MRFLLHFLAVSLAVAASACTQQDNCTSDFCTMSCAVMCAPSGPTCVAGSSTVTDAECQSRCFVSPAFPTGCDGGAGRGCMPRGCGEL